MKTYQHRDTQYSLTSEDGVIKKHLVVVGDNTGFQGELKDGLFYAPLSAHNAAVLRARLTWLNPQPLGLKTSFGFGDRLGLATPGHVAAVEGTSIAPIFAQQSVRENARTGRSPQIVLDDAMWALFEAGWRAPWGADADHVKEISDLVPFIQAGYSFYTIDPNQYVDNDAHTDVLDVLRTKVSALPWDALQLTITDLEKRYLGKAIILGDHRLEYNEETLLRATAKYGHAIAHIKSVADYLVKNVRHFDLEASVDETDTPTSPEEHFFIANELRRLEVPFVSLAPRFIGSFEKGVDYIGDLKAFEVALEKHTAVMHTIGGYKLSIHTGSDKFSIYPSIARSAKNLVHVKTAGTSYLEALRVVAAADPPFIRQILDFARSRYSTDRQTYHVSGNVEKVPESAELHDQELADLFEQFDARQVLHVTFGSALDEFGGMLKECLEANMDLYNKYLQTHFKRHLDPFVGVEA